MFDDPSQYIFPGVRFLPGDRSPCPVCGHPTGDCAGTASAPIRIIGDQFGPRKQESNVLVLEDLYEEVHITERTKTTVLVAKAGSYITTEKAIKYGLIPAPGF